MKGDYRIFVGAFPVGELSARIQSVRERYDPKTARITAPHVTLARTYWRGGPPSAENEAQTIRQLEAVCAHIPAFDLVLGGVRSFPPASKPVIYLGVEATSALLRARQALIGAMGPDKHRRFTPHLTLAMRLRGASARAMLADLQGGEWDDGRISAPIQALHLMLRGREDPAWRRIARFPLA